MELKNLKDFYNNQKYYSYSETRKKSQTALEKRIAELTFFANIAIFSILLALITYILVSMLSSLVAVPIAVVLALAIYISCKKGIAKAIHFLMK
ncbi:DUF3270 family protein [Lactococcus nasutitermitis]